MDDGPTGGVSDEPPDAAAGDRTGDVDADGSDGTAGMVPTMAGCGDGLRGAGGVMMMLPTFLGIA